MTRSTISVLVLCSAFALAGCHKMMAPVAETPHWSYEGESAPANWAALSGEWSVCGSGRTQSPIDLDPGGNATNASAPGSGLETVSIACKPSASVTGCVNNGHTVQVNCPGGSVLTVGDRSFDLVQFHFHSPSEHTVKGDHHPLEMHLVHAAADKSLAVLGVFIEEGAHNAALDPIWSNLPVAKGAEQRLPGVTLDIERLLPATLRSYRYDGSLTTPPCSESVKWVVLGSPIQMSAAQINAFLAIISGNNRPTQPLNGRAVQVGEVLAK